MKKTLLFLFVLTINNCNAATGYANDGVLFTGSVIVALLFLLGVGNFIDFLKDKAKAARTKHLLKKKMDDHELEFGNSTTEALPA